MMQSGGAAFKEAEIDDFEVKAYGAVLGLIYYRVIGDAARATWDSQIMQVIDDYRGQMCRILDQGQGNRQQADQAGGATPAFLQDHQTLVRKKQATSRALDFLVSLQQKSNPCFRAAASSDLMMTVSLLERHGADVTQSSICGLADAERRGDISPGVQSRI